VKKLNKKESKISQDSFGRKHVNVDIFVKTNAKKKRQSQIAHYIAAQCLWPLYSFVSPMTDVPFELEKVSEQSIHYFETKERKAQIFIKQLRDSGLLSEHIYRIVKHRKGRS
jgi:hypothetical protein